MEQNQTGFRCVAVVPENIAMIVFEALVEQYPKVGTPVRGEKPTDFYMKEVGNEIEVRTMTTIPKPMLAEMATFVTAIMWTLDYLAAADADAEEDLLEA
jgi:hypothetical protein